MGEAEGGGEGRSGKWEEVERRNEVEKGEGCNREKGEGGRVGRLSGRVQLNDTWRKVRRQLPV